MYFIKCANSTLYVAVNGERYIKCKKTGEVCCCQRYCPVKRNFELTPNAENCKLNPKNCKEVEKPIIVPIIANVEKLVYKKPTKKSPSIEIEKELEKADIKQEIIVEVVEEPIINKEECDNLKEKETTEEISEEKMEEIFEELGILDLSEDFDKTNKQDKKSEKTKKELDKMEIINNNYEDATT